MQKQFTNILWGTTLLSVSSTIIIIYTYLTEYWLVSTAVTSDQSEYLSEINYGLIFGTIERRLDIASGSEYRLTISCLLNKNICAWSCLNNMYERMDEIEDLYDSGAVSFGCHKIRSARSGLKLTKNITSADLEHQHNSYINATVWISTLICLATAGIICSASVVITIINIFYHPIRTFMTVQGLYVWHAVGAIFILFVILLWGSLYLMTLKKNVAIVDTIMGTLSSDGGAYLGYSYWLNLLPALFEGACIGLLYLRQRLYEQKPIDTIVPIDVGSSISHLY
uniref:Uncharacterized protein n=1 Tax=Clastoptera arizonana TaxID=38151 RepID=A0A1B6E324_9HEMI